MQEPDQFPPPSGAPAQEAPQRVVKVRRDYNSWVADETLEDYALRFTPRSARKWRGAWVANTAFGVASFLVLEAIGATLLVEYGFVNAFWAIVATGLIILLAGWPISVYAARHGVDMDLLTRGAGFGYIGSTITSLIYASFTFIFFALEAAVMAYALELAFDIPPAWGYLICALVVIPLVTHGVTIISWLQVLTQPIWLIMLVVPFVYVFQAHPGILDELAGYAGKTGTHSGFDLLAFGSALTVGIALITQMGEQADYLRFMPEPRAGRQAWRWWANVFIGGPGWVIMGVAKMLGGALLAYLAIQYAIPVEQALDPNQMYLVAWEMVVSHQTWAIAAVALFVVISQIKINVTNAYAGSLAWSNFFARVTHSHPGRVVWVVFNALIALLLMELNVFQALGKVLGLYANIAIAWMMAVVADLVVNKPMGWSPRGIEFKRAYLYDINPVGVGAMILASLVSMLAHVGWMGEVAQAFSAVIAMVVAFVTSPLIAWATGGRYYLARAPLNVGCVTTPAPPLDEGAPLSRVIRLKALHRCTVCEREYEADDIAQCPAYQGFICSLCCSLDARCQDLCKPHARWAVQWRALATRLMPGPVWQRVDTELGHFLLIMLVLAPLLAALFGLVYQQQLKDMGLMEAGAHAVAAGMLRDTLIKLFAALLLIVGVVSWWVVLTHKSRTVAQEESNRQTHLLVREIELHRITDEKLQQAKQTAEQANQAKSRYISTISHELRTPLNGILGYAQLLDEDLKLPEHVRHAVGVIKRGGDHLLSLIEGTLDIARIESGKLTLDVKPVLLGELLRQITDLIEHEARAKQLRFVADIDPALPEAVRADERRVRQILINVLGNAVKFTQSGEVTLRVRYAREIAHIEVSDTGPGIAQAELDKVFEPFARGSSAAGAPAGGTGLGLTISKMLTDLMGGDMTVHSVLGQGTTFRIRLFLPQVRRAEVAQAMPRGQRIGYVGDRRRVWTVDNEEADRGLIVRILEPLGFEVTPLPSGLECLHQLRQLPTSQHPDAIFMDLAMPGLDGWDTLRAIREERLTDAPVAIVSANAFDKALDNDVGIGADDFIVKPVRVPELLDWLGLRLALQWVEAARPAGLPGAASTAMPASGERSPTAAEPLPSVEALRTLEDQIHAGYVRGVHKVLDQIAASEPQCEAFVRRHRDWARQFQLDALAASVKASLTQAQS
ncbi:response regulator [Aquabacterium fontiphilum]|jgi:signal transduction histidine kinase/purine-cytosine permease-like protein/DNA-binding NarL/FixJ family response regulator|uniref:hybrid sensor histidine kinase/response regulator n=1 Tax=Aquabacterium fontiphilum TaxID=450365 RepID=UPI001378D151|nr:ATP-binding protein [Aquabacterium fontiphilum]NBD19824.1 response regulator [Aquabacterium fontiphilum]